jgi:hypothetical protein
MAQGPRSLGTRPGQCCKRNPERTDVWDETSGESGRQHWNKDPRLKEVTVSEEWKDIWEDFRENHHTGDCKVNSRIIYQTSKNEVLDIMEGSAPSKMEEPTCSFSVRRAGNVGALATLGSFAPTGCKKKKNFV